MKTKKPITHQVDAVVRWVWSLYCFHFNHKWVSIGGRACPKSAMGMMIINEQPEACSQTVYRCRHCKEWDHGYPGGPAWEECHDCSI